MMEFKEKSFSSDVSLLSIPVPVCRLKGSVCYAPSPVLVPFQCFIDARALTRLLSVNAPFPLVLMA